MVTLPGHRKLENKHKFEPFSSIHRIKSNFEIMKNSVHFAPNGSTDNNNYRATLSLLTRTVNQSNEKSGLRGESCKFHDSQQSRVNSLVLVSAH